MPVYRYLAISPQGAPISGVIEGASRTAVQQQLMYDGYLIRELRDLSLRSFAFWRNITSKELASFCRQMSVMLKAGVPQVRALELLKGRFTKKRFQQVLDSVRNEVNTGHDLAEACRKYPDVFPQIFVTSIELAVTSGTLSDAFAELSHYFTKEHKQRKALVDALAPPFFMILLTILAVNVIVTQAMPGMLNMLTDFNAKLPVTTQLLIAYTRFQNHYAALLLLGLLGFVAGLMALWLYYPPFKRLIDSLLLRIPLVREVLVKAALAQFCLSVYPLLRSAVKQVVSLELTAKLIRNTILRQAFLDAKEAIDKDGSPLSDSLERTGCFPAEFTQILRIAEETSDLPNTLQDLSQTYEEELNDLVKRLTGMINPALTIIIGALLLVIGFAIMDPMTALIDSAQV